jgi:hypothetical protein
MLNKEHSPLRITVSIFSHPGAAAEYEPGISEFLAPIYTINTKFIFVFLY